MPQSKQKDPFPPQGVDLSHPNVARIYDWILGGTANWAIDREFGERVLSALPMAKPMAMANRLFLHRAVRRLASLGVRQFVDIGSGVPTMGNTHQVAEEIDPDSRVVYVDNEPVAVAHSQVLLEQNGDLKRHAAINADLRDPDRLWDRVRDTGVIDFDQPLGLMLIAVMHFQQVDEDGMEIGAEVLARYRELLPSGSYLAISHATNDGVSDERRNALATLEKMYGSSSSSLIFRPRDEIRQLFGDFEMLEPGMCWAPEWHPEDSAPGAPVLTFDPPSDSVVWVGAARKA